MAKILFSRNNTYINKYREIGIFDEGKLLTKIKSGEELKLDVSLGKKTIYAKVDWAKSNKLMFEVNQGDIKHIHIKSKKRKYVVCKVILSFILVLLSPYIFEFSETLGVIYFTLSAMIIIDLLRILRLFILGKDLIEIEFKD